MTRVKGRDMSEQRPSTAEELRQATRFERERGTDVAVIWLDEGEERMVDVHDESLGGLGVYVKDPAEYQIGQEINVVYAGAYLRATVRHIGPHPGGDFVMGLRCEPTSKRV